MKTIKNTIIILFAFLLASCSKDKQTLTDNTWIVESMKVYADSVLQYPSAMNHRSITLSFPRISEYAFIMEANGCQGKVKLKNNYKINFSKETMCTLVGGDSQFAEDCLSLLKNNINHYSINDNKLILTGDNGETINFKKQQ